VAGEEVLGEWLAITDWDRCVDIARPGIVFEIRNGEGFSMFTPCVIPLPEMPFDWTLPPIEFRAVAEAPPEHSTPIPAPKR
jgi:hypothetical protein